jgi:two-component system chemotaxis sensor kinase CheA
MDELLTQFLVESRELVDKVVDDLLELEKRPDDVERFDDAFRGFHTLKGGAGIVEFDAMQKILHCAEDALAAARAAARPVAAGDIENCLRCLDRVVLWLDDIERGGAIPSDADPSDIVALFEEAGGAEGADAPAPAASTAWADSLLRTHASVAAEARAAVRYTPAADSFFRHEDPLAVVAALPGLLAIDVGPREPWPTLDALDPFSCNLVITALVAVSETELTTALGAERARCEVASLVPAAAVDERESMASKAHELLESQLRLLESGEPQQGRMASAGLVAANVLRHLRRSTDAENVETAAAVAIAEGRAEPLLRAIGEALTGSQSTGAREAPAAERRGAAQTIRVSAERIDALVRLTGELIIAKNSIGHALKLSEHGGARGTLVLKSQHAALDRLVNEIQRAVIGMRVLPLRVVFQRFPRLVREISAELHKPAVLVIAGEDTEADKAIVEALGEPLVHLVRNALDHGVEEPSARAAAAKPPVATIRLRALRSGEHVVVEVSDDGAGIDAAKIKRVALERNLATAEVLAAMSDEEALDLIFTPGFSTASAVSEISGRGVGMDAVRTAVSRLGGHVEARTERGKGTTVRLTLPFSVLITQVMTVEAGGQSFGIPLESIVETLRADAVGVFPVGAARAIVLRDKTVPLVRLADLLAKGESPADGGPIVIAQLGGELGAVQVDKIGERMDIILTPLEGLLADVPGLAGSALLGDGSVLLVLDIAEFVQ